MDGCLLIIIYYYILLQLTDGIYFLYYVLSLLMVLCWVVVFYCVALCDMRINNKDVDLLALWILFFVRKKFVSSRNYLYFPVQVPNINTSFKIFVSSRKQPFYMFRISIPRITVLLVIIIIIILWQSLYHEC